MKMALDFIVLFTSAFDPEEFQNDGFEAAFYTTVLTDLMLCSCFCAAGEIRGHLRQHIAVCTA